MDTEEPADSTDPTVNPEGEAEPAEETPQEDTEALRLRIKELSDENAKHRVRAKSEKQRADTAEAMVATLQKELPKELQIENAFLKAVAKGEKPILDAEAAFKLLDREGVTAPPPNPTE
ncbi:MAG: hypothetical protein KY429_01550 [Actinobacteria bacterium]|nr:hypothetical protein [Actinomycetota bacterium]